MGLSCELEYSEELPKSFIRANDDAPALNIGTRFLIFNLVLDDLDALGVETINDACDMLSD